MIKYRKKQDERNCREEANTKHWHLDDRNRCMSDRKKGMKKEQSAEKEREKEGEEEETDR